MPNLDEFLSNNVEQAPSEDTEEVTGSFRCQENDCYEIVNIAERNRLTGKIYWTCSKDHKSSVIL